MVEISKINPGAINLEIETDFEYEDPLYSHNRYMPTVPNPSFLTPTYSEQDYEDTLLHTWRDENNEAIPYTPTTPTPYFPTPSSCYYDYNKWTFDHHHHCYDEEYDTPNEVYYESETPAPP